MARIARIFKKLLKREIPPKKHDSKEIRWLSQINDNFETFWGCLSLLCVLEVHL